MIYLIVIITVIVFGAACFFVGLAWSRLGPDGMKALVEREHLCNTLYDENARLQGQIEDMRAEGKPVEWSRHADN